MGPALAGKLPSGSGGLMGGRSAGARTPYFLLDEEKLLRNLEILKEVSDRAGCKILLAQKAFSMFSVYPLIRKYLAGTAASGLYEARLGAEEFGGETHVFSPAYRRDEFEEILKYADHLVFNSPGQVKKFGERAKAAGKSIGLRLNPECSTQEGHAIYDPCAPGSRLGTTLEELEESLLPMLDGFHMHTLCEQNSDALEVTLRAAEEKFGKYFAGKRWLNLGGGHHITREDYDRERLIRLIRHLKNTYGTEVYLEPGEAVGTSLGEFFSEEKDEQIVFTANDFFENFQEDYNIYYVVPNAQKNRMEPILIHLKKGGRSEEIPPSESEEFGYVLAGKVRLHYGDKELIVKRGQTFYMKSDRAHYLSNDWETEAKVLWISTPPSF